MERLFQSIFGVHRQEQRLAGFMGLYHFLLLVSLYLLKPVRDSLFLSGRGPEELPFVFILTTVVVVPVAFFHMRASRRLNVGPLIDGVSLVLVLSLVALRGLLGAGGEWMTYLLYAWVSIYGLLVTSQFWLMANALFTASQSKRVFTVLSAGAILGAIVGGEVTGLLVEVGLESENLLLAAAGVLLASTGLGRWIRGFEHQGGGGLDEEPNEPAPDEAMGAASIIRDSRHVQLIVGILTLMVVVSTLVDYQFKTVAAQAFPTEDGLTSFMGQFYGRVSIIALLVQFVLAPWMMRLVGIGGALAVLPGMLALGSAGMLIVPGLAAGVFLRGAGQSLKHSIDKTGRELLFVPVPLEQKKQVKVFIDLFVDQGAQGLGGMLLLGLAVWAGMSVKMLSVVVLVLVALWAMLAYRVRHTYVDLFRRQLREQEREVEAGDERDQEEPPLDGVLESLCTHAERKVLPALDELKTSDVPVPVSALLCLLDHPSATVRADVLRVFRRRDVAEVGGRVAEALRDPDPDVQLEAARYLYCEETDDYIARLREGLNHDDPQIQAAMVGLIAEEGDPDSFRLVPDGLLQRLVDRDGAKHPKVRVHVARILGTLDRPYRNDLLHRLLDDPEPEVVRAAIEAVGQTGERTFVPLLVQYLEDDAFERAARHALIAFERPLCGALYDALVDERHSRLLRRRIPPIFAERPSQLGLDLLVRSLGPVPIPVRHEVVRALSKVHAAGDFTCDAEAVESTIEEEVEHYVLLGQVLNVGRTAEASFARSQLESLRGNALERIFRLLGLRYDQRDLYDAYLGITSDDPKVHDSAVEFVDNLIDYSVRRYLLPVLETPGVEQAGDLGENLFDRRIETPTAARRYAETVDDPRLRESVMESETAAPSEDGRGDGGSAPATAPSASGE